MALKDITLGQYFPGSSLLHRLDPRCKLLITVCYIVALFMAKNILGYALCFAVLVKQPPQPPKEEERKLVASHGGQSESAAHKTVRADIKVGRNDPCPCGSGKKYKECCGRGK